MFGASWSPRGKHCYVTGGTAGLGLSVARQLTKAGAHVSIVARDAKRLETALAELERPRVHESQILRSYSFDLFTLANSRAAIEAASQPHGGRCPDVLLLCAGSSTPAYVLEMTEEDHIQGMNYSYWVQAWSAFAASKMMVEQNVKGRIVFVGSMLSYMSFVGYASYAPGKHALRGLADTLRSEMLLYDIKIQMFFPNTILSPGYEREALRRPDITTMIEESDKPGHPDAVATSMLAGVKKGDPHISGDILTSLFRSSARGSTPYGNVFLENIYGLIGWIGIPIWRQSVDAKIRAYRGEHRAYLVKKGIIQAQST